MLEAESRIGLSLRWQPRDCCCVVVVLWCCANANYLSVKHWAEAGIFLIPVPDRGLALLCTKPLCSLMMIKWYIFVSWLQPGPGPGTAVVVLHSRATLRNTISCFLKESRRMQLKINSTTIYVKLLILIKFQLTIEVWWKAEICVRRSARAGCRSRTVASRVLTLWHWCTSIIHTKFGEIACWLTHSPCLLLQICHKTLMYEMVFKQ